MDECLSALEKVLKIDDSTCIDDSHGSPLLVTTIETFGEEAIGYSKIGVPTADKNQDTFTKTITNLTTHQEYYFQVSSYNKLGYSKPCESVPRKLAPIRQKPSSPTQVYLRVKSGHALEVSFSSPESDSGDAVIEYKLNGIELLHSIVLRAMIYFNVSYTLRYEDIRLHII